MPPALLSLVPVYRRGDCGGPWLKKLLARPEAPEDAFASVEFSSDPASGIEVREGPLAGRSVPELLREFPEELAGPRVSALLESGGHLETRFIAADRGDSPLLLAKASSGSLPKNSAFSELHCLYLMEARERAAIYCGKKKGLSSSSFQALLTTSPSPEVLRSWPAAAGWSLVAVPGLPYALGKGAAGHLAVIQSGPKSKPAARGRGRGIQFFEPDPRALFKEGLGFIRGMNAFTFLYAAVSLATVRLELREEYREKEMQAHSRQSLAVLSCLEGEALVTAGDETEPLRKGKSVLVAAACKDFKISPGPDGAAILKTWLADLETEVFPPLSEAGVVREEIESLVALPER